MTVESSIKRLLIFSRRFRSAMMWSRAYDAGDAAPRLLREALRLVGGGDPWAGSGKLRGGGAAASSTMAPLPGCAEPVTKFQLTNGRLVLLLGGRARLINELGGDCGQEPWPSLAAAGARSLLKNDLQECFDFF